MTTRETGAAEPAFDPSVAHPARVYNVWLGGKDHYAADRDAAQRVAGCRPQVVAGALANRQFLGRVVRYLAGKQGVRQFLDIGTGLPAPDNTHEVAQAIDPAARIVYADHDPVVLAHARALLGSAPDAPATISAPTCTTRPPSWPGRPGPWTSPVPPRSCS